MTMIIKSTYISIVLKSIITLIPSNKLYFLKIKKKQELT